MSTNIRLLSNRVLIDVGSMETKTPSGVFVSKVFEPSDVNSGVIESVGEGKWTAEHGKEPRKVKVGDKVMFQYGQKVQIDGKNYILATEDDVVMILESTK